MPSQDIENIETAKSNIGFILTTSNRLNHDRIVAGIPTKSISFEANCITLHKYINYVDIISSVSNVTIEVDTLDG
jgi:hypothetical protein